MTKEENKAFIRRFIEQFNIGAPAATEDFFAPDCLACIPGSFEPTNLDGFRQFVNLLYTAFPDLQHRVEAQIAENDYVVTRVTVRGSHTGYFQGIAPTGKQVIITDIIITRIKEGKILELWAQFDVLGLLQQLGVNLSQN